MIRIYIIAGLVSALAFGGFYWRYSYVVDERDNLKQTVVAQDKKIEAQQKAADKQQKLINSANERDKKNAEAKKVVDDENQKYRTCIANKSCGIELRFRPKIVQLPCGDTEPGRPRDSELPLEFGSDFESWYLDLKHSVDLDAQAITACQKDVLARSDKNYCRVE